LRQVDARRSRLPRVRLVSPRVVLKCPPFRHNLGLSTSTRVTLIVRTSLSIVSRKCTKMPRQNVVIESTRQRRLRLLRMERMDVMEPLFEEMEHYRAEENALTIQMHTIQRRLEELKRKAGQVAARIDDEQRYYDHGELKLAEWPKDCHVEPAAPVMPRFGNRRAANREPPAEWEPTMPSVPCFVTRHPVGTPEHLVSQCGQFRDLTASDRALLIRRRSLCWGCWIPLHYVDGCLHDGSNCDHPRSCMFCGAGSHHSALCGAPLVMTSTLEEARQERLLREHH
jgi:hypothetical protein